MYQITSKQKAQLEHILAKGSLPHDTNDKTIVELFNTLTDENGSMRLRYKEYCRQLLDINQRDLANKEPRSSSIYPYLAYNAGSVANSSQQPSSQHSTILTGTADGQYLKENKNGGLDS